MDGTALCVLYCVSLGDLVFYYFSFPADRRTDGRTPDRYIDPTPHSVRAASMNFIGLQTMVPMVKYEMLGLAAKYVLSDVREGLSVIRDSVWSCFAQKVQL